MAGGGSWLVLFAPGKLGFDGLADELRTPLRPDQRINAIEGFRCQPHSGDLHS